MRNTVIRRLSQVWIQADLTSAQWALEHMLECAVVTQADYSTAHTALQKGISALCKDGMLNNPSLLYTLGTVYRAITPLQDTANSVDWGDCIQDARAACVAVVQAWQAIICDDCNPASWLDDARATQQLEDAAIDAYHWYGGDVTLCPKVDDDTMDAVDGLWDDDLPDDTDDGEIIDWLEAAREIAALAEDADTDADTMDDTTMDDNLRDRIAAHVREVRNELAAIELLLQHKHQ